MKKSNWLAPFGLLYGVITNARNEFYDRGLLESVDLGVMTISVGNITVGGTGKTPLVSFIAEVLADTGEKVCILTRGYKRENERERVIVSDGEKVLTDVRKAGDEPFELANKLLGKAVVIADAKRAQAGAWARKKFGITAFILDDAFQHRQVARSLDIVCVDATNPFGGGKILPQGILREPLENLRRADAIVITRANLIENVSNLKTQISNLNPDGKIFVSKNELNSVFSIPHSAFAAFCALGNPENFFAQLKQEKINLVLTKTFPDHYFYTQKDIDELEEEAREKGAKGFITTAKDAVKLTDLKFSIPYRIAENTLIFNDENAFRSLILESK